MTGRFAPSPTSALHLGNLRTALVAWLMARSSGRRFVLRIEDLDTQRVAAAAGIARRQVADLAAIGLDFDGEPLWQSTRADAYAAALFRLGPLVYECYCTRREIAEAAVAPHAAGHRPYPGTCRELDEAERARRRAIRPPALRVRADAAVATVHDEWAGAVSGVVDDFVLVRNDGVPAYNLAVVVDDLAQGVDQVVRGDDLLASSPRQAWLSLQLGGTTPGYAHVPLLLGEGGRRLAKRDGAITLAERRALGQTAAQLRGELAASVGLARAGEAPALGDLVARTRDLLHSGVPA